MADLRAYRVRSLAPTRVSYRGLGNMVLSVATARRGGATRADIVNTRPWDALKKTRFDP